MAIDKDTENRAKRAATEWMTDNPQFDNWTLGRVQSVNRATYNKEEGHSEGLPDGLIVTINCASCGKPIAHYDPKLE